MAFKKIIGKLHLWLGFTSGLLVFFLGITGCILAFEKEIETLTVPERFVQPQQKSYIKPSMLKITAEEALSKDRKIISIEYPGINKAALAYYYNTKEYYTVLLNPYTGKVLRVKNMNKDFFRVVINGHYYLWLPPAIGQPIMATATLVFVIMLITGIILWWPKNKAAQKQRFKIKLNVKWRRRNYDLHNVLGFYISWVIIFIALSGLVMGFQWVSKSIYWVTSGGKSMPAYSSAVSDTSGIVAGTYPFANTDIIWQKKLAGMQEGDGITVDFPAFKDASIGVTINHKPGTYYNTDNYYFDQYSLKKLSSSNVLGGRFTDASLAAKIQRMNYDIHVGAIGGLPTKILAFCASLIAASLPVTGFIIWYGRRKNTKRKSSIIPLTFINENIG